MDTKDFSFPYFGSTSIPLGELRELGGFDWENDSELYWDSYDDEQYKRLCSKILERYMYREIGIVPVARWRQTYVRKMNEIMPKYKLMYSYAEKGINPMQTSSEYEKSRDIFSDFPATHLSGNSDYTSTGTDREFEKIYEGDVVEKMADFSKNYRDIDVMILDEIDVLFTCVLTSTVPVY